MKKISLSILSLLFCTAWLSAQGSDNNGVTKESEVKKEKKVIVKKVIRSGSPSAEEAQIEVIVDSVLGELKGNEDGRKVKVFIHKDGKTKEINGNNVEVIVEESDDEDAPMMFHWNEDGGSNMAKCDAPNKAVLGVQLRDAGGDNGAAIDQVYEGSGAEKAGLQEGDMIMKIDGKRVSGFESVVELMSDKKVGDKVKVVYLRNGEEHKTTVTLGKCSPEMCQPKCKAGNMKNFHWNEQGMNEEQKQILREHNSEGAVELEQEAFRLKDLGREISEELNAELKSLENRNKVQDESLEITYLSGSPNPSQGQLKIKYQGAKGPMVLQVLDLNGKELYKEDLKEFNGSYDKEINIDHVKGTVILKITQVKKVLSEKIIVE